MGEGDEQNAPEAEFETRAADAGTHAADAGTYITEPATLHAEMAALEAELSAREPAEPPAPAAGAPAVAAHASLDEASGPDELGGVLPEAHDPAELATLPAGTVPAPGLELLYDIELDATLQFGAREMPLRELLELGPGDVVELDRHVSEPVDLLVGNRIVARGEVVIASGNFALRVTEVAAPQMRLESVRCLF